MHHNIVTINKEWTFDKKPFFLTDGLEDMQRSTPIATRSSTRTQKVTGKRKQPNPIQQQELPLKRAKMSHESSDKASYVLFNNYRISKAAKSFTHVDRTHFYKDLLFEKIGDDESLPESVSLIVGMIVCVWKYGNEPFAIHGITNNNGTSSIYKVVLQSVENLSEPIPESPSSTAISPPENEEVRAPVSDIWYLFKTVLDVNVETYPEEKRKINMVRKKGGAKNRVRLIFFSCYIFCL